MKPIEEVRISASDGASIRVKKGQVLRVKEVEDGQVGDMVVLNEHDFREAYSAWASQQLQENIISVKTLYSNPPFIRPLLTIEDDLVRTHWPGASRCNRFYLDKIGRRDQKLGCQEILESVLSPYGIQPYNVPDVFSVFMKVNIHRDGAREVVFRSGGKKGDYTDFRASVDCLVGMSACPSIVGKPLLVQVLE